uniref:ribosomal protein L33 n=1 Tax=Vacuolaria virescens TaxID=44451 RepID=UPI002113F69B|nr:ribosomal protein L33 [Vacuolaria virescens]UTE94660.1 ribosomal protein L33 [Vacuolaria virescens]
MAKKNKGSRIIITLECTNCRVSNEKRAPGVSRYSTTKNRKNTPARLELKKYCQYCDKHLIHKETK